MPDPALSRGYVLSFDFGFRRIGVAVGQSATRTASVLETVIHRDQPDWAAIDRLVREWKPELFVVGLPLNSAGEETDMTRAARSFGQALLKRYEGECVYVDERLSSRAAQDRFSEMRAGGALKRKHASKLDSMAAQIILENWLQSLPARQE
ncbi:MAG TPA: Holliday junction resolvase RuvX [Xanthomonadales bacterium]|nr:Holliday junction resolvase RuvX [Xanthomonadales bacterium]